MVSYNYVTSLRTKFFSEAEQPPVSGAASSSVGVLNEATVDMMALVALEQFENQPTNRLLLSTLIWRNMKTEAQKKENAKKTPVKMLPSTLCKHKLYVKMCIFVVNDNNKQLKFEIW